MKLENLAKFRYLFLIAVVFLLINSVVFMVIGAVECVHGYIAIVQDGFADSDHVHPQTHLLEGLDIFVSSLVFMMFGLGLGQLFLFDKRSSKFLPSMLRVGSLKELKVLLWETILVALIIFCVTHLIRSDIKSWDILPFPILILVLSLALFFVKSNGFGHSKGNTETDNT